MAICDIISPLNMVQFCMFTATNRLAAGPQQPPVQRAPDLHSADKDLAVSCRPSATDGAEVKSESGLKRITPGRLSGLQIEAKPSSLIQRPWGVRPLEGGHDIGDAYRVFVFSAGDVIAGCRDGGNRLVLLYLL